MASPGRNFAPAGDFAGQAELFGVPLPSALQHVDRDTLKVDQIFEHAMTHPPSRPFGLEGPVLGGG